MSLCPCGSGQEFNVCCEPLLAGKQIAPTAEALMRSRYSAYVNGQIHYLSETLHPEQRHDHDVEATRRWAGSSEWLGLEIHAVEAGGEGDEEGMVEFIATFKEKGVVHRHHEQSRFKREEGRWYYVDGEVPTPGTYIHEQPKVGRNEPCLCGSGKKHKKCCGRQL